MSELNSTRIRLGIVGTGLMAKERLQTFSEADRTILTGVYSRNRDRAQKLCDSAAGVAYDDYSDMLADCDAVVICAPNNLHYAFASEALSAGKHVLVEYPLAVSMKEVDSLQSLAGERNRVLMVGNTIIHEAMFSYLQKNAGRLGQIVSAASRLAFYSKDLTNAWYMNPKMRGPLFSTFHYHHIEYYRRFLGEVEWAVGRDESKPSETIPGYDRISGGTLLLGHEQRRTSCIQWYLSASGNGLPRTIWINGTESSVTILSKEVGKSEVIWDDGGEGKVEIYEDNWGVSGSCEDFVDAIEGTLNYSDRLAWDIETLKVGLLASNGKDVVLHHR